MEKSALTNLGIKLAKFILGFWKTHLCFCFYKYISIFIYFDLQRPIDCEK